VSRVPASTNCSRINRRAVDELALLLQGEDAAATEARWSPPARDDQHPKTALRLMLLQVAGNARIVGACLRLTGITGITTSPAPTTAAVAAGSSAAKGLAHAGGCREDSGEPQAGADGSGAAWGCTACARNRCARSRSTVPIA
jgi:hypothetical protein